jgi:hypothetical protein
MQQHHRFAGARLDEAQTDPGGVEMAIDRLRQARLV